MNRRESAASASADPVTCSAQMQQFMKGDHPARCQYRGHSHHPPECQCTAEVGAVTAEDQPGVEDDLELIFPGV